MWAHADAQGFNLRIDYMLLNDAETVVVRVAGDKEAEGGGASATPAPAGKAGRGSARERRGAAPGWPRGATLRTALPFLRRVVSTPV
jgi:hypothetical protein